MHSSSPILYISPQILLLPKCLGADVDLVDAWGKERGTWVEGSGSVYAPEEVRGD